MTQHDLPLPDYDSLPMGSIESRVRTLDTGGVGALLTYEKEHANRLAVVRVLEQRLEALEQGAEPSGGDPQAVAPEAGTAAGGTQAPVKEGPAVNPPSQGVPTNPAQPRT